jgi:hypothetical protein
LTARTVYKRDFPILRLGDAIELVADQAARALAHHQAPIVGRAEVGHEAKAMPRKIVSQLVGVEPERPALARSG